MLNTTSRYVHTFATTAPMVLLSLSSARRDLLYKEQECTDLFQPTGVQCERSTSCLPTHPLEKTARVSMVRLASLTRDAMPSVRRDTLPVCMMQ